MKHIRIIVGGTGSGKDYLVKELNKSIRGNTIVKSMTTRDRRKDEGDEKYIFKKEFTIDEVIECNTFENDHYGLSKDDLLNKLNTKDDLSIIIEPNGIIELLLWLKNNNSIIKVKFHLEIVFLNIPRSERFQNLVDANLDLKTDIDYRIKVNEAISKALDRIVRNGDNIDSTFKRKFDTVESIIKQIPNARLPFLILNNINHIIELNNRDSIDRYLRISMGKRK